MICLKRRSIVCRLYILSSTSETQMQISPTNLNLFSPRQKTSINMNMYRRNAGFNYFELVRVLSLLNHSLMTGTSLTLLFSENMTERGKFNISAVFLLYMYKTVSWLKTKTNSPTKRNNKESSIKNNTWANIK